MRISLFLSLVILLMSINMHHIIARDFETNSFVEGYVFFDSNSNGYKEWWEPGISSVVVSNGIECTESNCKGKYILPAYEEMTVMISKPTGFNVPVSKNNIPQFYYIHQPNGSPEEIQEYKGLDPTGSLPRYVNFPLYRKHPSKNLNKFKAIIMGDPQVYSDAQIDYLRNSVVKDVTKTSGDFVVVMGDNVGENLNLFPRYLEVMSEIGRPLYLVPGNADMNFDAESPEYAFETFKREFGPIYYSFNYGKVHFVVLNSIVYPSPIYSTATKKSYHGEISQKQMEWLANDLSFVPNDHLIVLNMHIPVASFTDRSVEQHQVANRQELYDLLNGYKAVSLGGHAHTLTHFLPGEEEYGWGQPTPIPQVIVGAACGSWWSGDLDEDGIPFSYQRLGAPRGFMKWRFNGSEYNDTYVATGKHFGKQMHISFLKQSFENWYEPLWDWVNKNPENRESVPPFSISDLPDMNSIKISELASAKLIVNVWNSSADSKVKVYFDSDRHVVPERNREIIDPYVLRTQASVLRYAVGFQLFSDVQYGPSAPQPLDAWLHTRSSSHIWSVDVPSYLEPGVHTVKVKTEDIHGNRYTDKMVFDVVPD